MYRKSLSNLLGGSLLLVATSALNACGGGEAGPGEGTPTGGTTGTPSTNGAGTPATTGTAGKTAGGSGATANAAGAKAQAGTGTTTSGVASAGKSGGAGTTAAAAGAAGGGTAAAAGSSAAAGASAGGAAGAMAGAAGAAAGGSLGGPLKYTGPFTMGMSKIPAKHRCPSTVLPPGMMGDNKSPPLAWSGGPAETKSFAVVLFDTSFSMLHWAIWDIPASVNQLPEGLASGYEVPMPAGAHQVANMGMDDHAYYGPCTAGSSAGNYEFRLYALKEEKLAGLSESSTGAQAQMAIEGAMLERVVWAGMPE